MGAKKKTAKKASPSKTRASEVNKSIKKDSQRKQESKAVK